MELIYLLLAFFFIGGGAITTIIMFVEIKKHRPVKMASNADLYVMADKAHMTVSEDTFLRTHTITNKVS